MRILDKEVKDLVEPFEIKLMDAQSKNYLIHSIKFVRVLLKSYM